MAKEKKIVFSEEIDSSIDGFALGFSFIVSAMIVWKFNVFHNNIANVIAQTILVVLGICGTFTEIDKLSKNDKKGFGDIALGAPITIGTVYAIWKWDNILFNIVCFSFLLLGLFGTAQGLMRVVYSINISVRKSPNRKVGIVKIIALITELVALAVAVVQLVTEISKII